PHDAEHAELGERRLASERALDTGVLFVRQTVLCDRVRGDHAAATASQLASDSKIARPSVPPTAPSTRRSGCGISPTTFPRGFEMPAMSRAAPFGAPPTYRKTTCPSPSR